MLIQKPIINQRPQKKNKYQGKGLINSVIDKLPVELHIPGYNFCGPGTKLTKRLARGHRGINKLDEACKEHDIAYNNYKNIESRHKADVLNLQKKNFLNAKDALSTAITAVKSLKGRKKVKPVRVIPVPKVGGFLPLIPIFAALGALGSLGGGAAAIAKTVIAAKDAKENLKKTKDIIKLWKQ
ncbi:hypothetical protein RN001_006494 [Aquatica leii]|uniref:Phospholipase A2-like domain-containing protein n=1 Tax=Aquatica leii TaxID=1421715 RepID=A0AAN7Q8W0_9COLE|nr:hypothetical protein RN001_006494 [Aquatica leii]